MGSTFGGLSVASSGLAAQRRAIETAGHNVANANTQGYSRQRVDLAAISGGAISVHAGTFYTGAGVEVVGQNRIVDQFLINRVNSERATLGLNTEQQTINSRIELMFGEPGENGLSSQLEEFWSAWDTVAMRPQDAAGRTALLNNSEALAAQFQSLSRQVTVMTEDSVQRADSIMTDINGISAQIANLNIAVTASLNAGAPPNDLLDQRDELVRKLSDYVGVTTRSEPNGQMQISIGGAALVTGGRFNTVSLDSTVPGAAVVRVSNSPSPLRVSTGQVAGLIQSANATLPAVQQGLDAVANQIRDVVNAQHGLGQDLSGNPGGAFFSGTGAGNFSLAAGMVDNPSAVAAATVGEGAFSGNNAVAMAELSGLNGGPDDSYRALIADIGVTADVANQRFNLQSELTKQVDGQREAVSGVSIDEEMAGLVAFQQAFDASARIMTAIDQMLDTLINGTGLVGR